MEDKPTYDVRPHFVVSQKETQPFRLSTWVAIIAWICFLALAWLMIGRVVPAEGMNKVIFWVFLVVAVGASLAQASPTTKPGGSSGGSAAASREDVTYMTQNRGKSPNVKSEGEA